MNKNRYRVIQHHDVEQFMTEVNEAIADGWKPLGGVRVMSLKSYPLWYIQSLVQGEVSEPIFEEEESS